MADEILQALLRICGNGVKPGIENWQELADILVRLERELLGLQDAGGRYGASVLAIAWARRACQQSNRAQMLKALNYAIEQLEAKTTDLKSLNASLVSADSGAAASGWKERQQATLANSRAARAGRES